MTHRFTRSEKEKWVAGTLKSARRRSPVRIPQCDTSALIEENKFTLIGRVTNPSVQKPKAVVGYMPQLWNLENRVVGRDLGSECFQFRFENDADLQSVLRRGPYHFKNWMLILQQWEPIISDTFPAFITFWIKIHGIPLHFWSDQTIRTIGKELGALSARDVAEGRVRVPINGLEPLEMSMPIRLPDGSVKTVELEYEKLEKHCFNCFELSHEKKDCHRPLVSRSLGINQLKATQRLESERRRHEDRREDRQLTRPLVDRNRGNREHRSNREPGLSSRFTSSRDYRPLSLSRDSRATIAQRYPSRSRDDGNERHRSRTPPSRHYSAAGEHYYADQSRASQKGVNGSVADEGGHLSARGRDISKSESHRNPPRQISHHRSPSRRSNNEVASRSGKSRCSGTPPPCPPRHPLVVPMVGETGEGSSVQHSRRPALERISPRVHLNASMPTSSRTNSERLQDVEIQYAENNHHDMLGVIQNNSMATAEQRIPTSLRLGPIPPVPQPKAKAKGAPRKKANTATTSKATGRRKSTKASPKRRVVRNSPLQGISLRKRNVSRPNTKKKLDVDPQEQDDALPETQDPMDIGQARMGSTLTVRRLREIRMTIFPDILFLTETKNQDSKVLSIVDWMGYDNHFTVPPDGLSGGLALFWKGNVSLEILASSPNLIDVQVKFQKQLMFITFIYGLPQTEIRASFWDSVSLMGANRSGPWLLSGDFNDTLDNSEKVGGPARCEGSFIPFRSFVAQNGLWDVKHSGNHFSWRGWRYDYFIKSRLDRSLANCSWFEAFPAGRCEYLRFEGSDHRPLVTFLDDSIRKNKGAFRFDRRLTDNEEIRCIVDQAWKSHQEDSVLGKLNRCRAQIIKWTKAQNANSSKLIKEAQEALEGALSASSPDQSLISTYTSSLEKLYREEELFWRQRSRIQWLQSGDRNSAFFHAATRARRAINNVSVIEDDYGHEFHDEDQIAQTISTYYQAIFTAGPRSSNHVVEEALEPKVTLEMNSQLTVTPTQLEIKEAVFSIHPDKAPGPDGFSSGFYQSFWDIIGEDVCMDIRSFLDSSFLSQRLNETHIRMIPKITGPRKVSDYRPIALCTVHYKIIAKILSKRLQPLLSNLISINQSAFVANRAITDNVLITHEVLHYLRTSEAKVRCSMAVKTDMSKAYDRIEWPFLEAVLKRLGFNEKWTSWIMACVCSVSYSFLVKGTPKGQVIPSRGLRQGDPLSPYLFILCTEVLSGLCHRAQRHGVLPGIKVAKGSPPINHLLFADDTMFFCRSNPKSCHKLMEIITRYGEASGQLINFDKSAITFSKKTPLAMKIAAKQKLGINKEGGVGKYLGLPEHFGRRKKDIFTSIVDRIRQRSHSWTSRFLSAAGKQILLKSVLAAMPLYAMSCFKLPLSLCKRIQSILTRFWWDDKPDKRKISWVAWNTLTLPKSEGGLGFREIEQFNDALLGRISWKILHFPDSLLARVLLGKYCREKNFLEVTASSSCSHGWRSILAGREVLLKGLGWTVGDGSSINIWKDPWLSTDLPRLPIGPPTEENRHLKVSALLQPETNDWNATAIQKHLPQYEESICKLIPSSNKKKDALVWLPERKGFYTTKTGYMLAKLNSNAPISENFNWQLNIWKIRIPPKLKMFLWKVKRKALSVGNNLSCRGIVCDLLCKRCGERESELHILIHCSFARRVWDLAPLHRIPRSESSSSLGSLLTSARQTQALPPLGITHSSLYHWILWYLWKSRNLLIFENRIITEEETITKAIVAAKEWQAAQPIVKTPQRCRTTIVPPTEASLIHVPLIEDATLAIPHIEDSTQALPPDEVLLCFTDAAWNASSGSCGMGWIFKTQHRVIHRGSAFRRHTPSALAAEALAMKYALTAASRMEVTSINVFSDSQVLISLLNTETSTNELQGILHDIALLCHSFVSCTFSFIPREANVLADGMAKAALASLNSPAL
ncbi:Ribonuclease H domain [Arabidopsis suecica]|uniref:Ribonuclease H domain n=1 Tax=Arabidopsis suecica TaxID=45249 RepID=A0A8T1XYS7_ARASU|nr:Ribonuclease H domain [Arabidopsis suecica]